MSEHTDAPTECQHEWQPMGRRLIDTEHGTFAVEFDYCPKCDAVKDANVYAR